MQNLIIRNLLVWYLDWSHHFLGAKLFMQIYTLRWATWWTTHTNTVRLINPINAFEMKVDVWSFCAKFCIMHNRTNRNSQRVLRDRIARSRTLLFCTQPSVSKLFYFLVLGWYSSNWIGLPVPLWSPPTESHQSVLTKCQQPLTDSARLCLDPGFVERKGIRDFHSQITKSCEFFPSTNSSKNPQSKYKG